MGVSKSHIFTEEQQQLAEVFKVLSNPARLAILQYIASQESCICGEIVSEIGLAQATISQHLKEIKHIGLLKGNFTGPKLMYRIDTERWNSIRNQFQDYFTLLETNNCK